MTPVANVLQTDPTRAVAGFGTEAFRAVIAAVPGLQFTTGLDVSARLEPYAVHYVGQTAHLDVQSVAATIEPVSPIGDGHASGQPPGTDNSRSTLRVSGFSVTASGFRIRFNQPLDAVRLLRLTGTGRSADAHVVVMHGTRAVHGVLVVDPDQQGFAFVAASGLNPGEYSVLLRDGGGAFATAKGELLDGDGDGKPGGEFKVRFRVQARPDLRAPIASDAPATTSAADSEIFTPALGGPGVVATWLAGGIGGMALHRDVPRRTGRRSERAESGAGSAGRLRAMLGPQDVGEAPADAVRLRAGMAVPTEFAGPLAERPAWLGGWLGVRCAPTNDWRIRL